jgi:SAM-dependent methyltransferase
MNADPSSDALYRDPRLADFYDLDNGWNDDTRYCEKLAREVRSVLDLGCGTGLLAASCAAFCDTVVGVDPAKAMLDIAWRRPGGDKVRWVEGDGRTVRLDQRFDLIFLTGHAFQVFLTDADQLAALKTIAAHLTPEGRFIFDSRNPHCQEWLEWSPAESRRMVEHPRHGAVESWNDYVYDPAAGVVTYDTYYRLPGGELLAAKSQIKFTSQERLAVLIDEAGLTAERWLGDWRGNDFAPESKEAIPVGCLKT